MIIELCGDTEVFVIVAMASIGEVEKPTVEQPAGKAPGAEEQPQAAAKPVKEKKVRVPKEKKAKVPKTATHPPYFQVRIQFQLFDFALLILIELIDWNRLRRLPRISILCCFCV